ncbi:hypothetical protein [Rhizobium lentis]|uniref:hypothetical protein n=1 Tax=Rhizobium lentis TaxID=1138194 RepID=UPI001C8348F7|nr:hypothetical protein [Rhizobium lentis]
MLILSWNRALRRLIALALLVVSTAQAGAQQFDPRQVLATLILQLQTGTPNPGLIGPQLWQTIAMQTNNSGIYPPLQQLGQVTGINLIQQIPLPNGAAFVMAVQHQNGQSNWQIAISQMSGKVEYAGFNIGQLPPRPNPNPNPNPNPIPTPTPDPPPGPGPITPSDACAKYPDLC